MDVKDKERETVSTDSSQHTLVSTSHNDDVHLHINGVDENNDKKEGVSSYSREKLVNGDSQNKKQTTTRGELLTGKRRGSFFVVSTPSLIDGSSANGPYNNVWCLFTSLMGDLHSLIWFFGSLIFIWAWSCICAWGSIQLTQKAEEAANNNASKWLEWIDNTSDSVRVLGILFTFALIFRFNTCYNRWWEGRIVWGDIIASSIDIDQMNRNWIANEGYSDRFSRYVIVFVYACKAILRGHSLAENNDDKSSSKEVAIGNNGQYLLEKGFITKEELDDMANHPCWEPHYALDMLRAIMTQVYVEGGDLLIVDDSHKAYGQFLRCFDNAIVRLSTLIGSAIRVRSAGLPNSYDAIHHIIFYFYFILAPVSWGPSMGWMLPFVVGMLSFVALALINLGSTLVDPFGTDLVDLPLDKYCKTIEVQTIETCNRAKRVGADGDISQKKKFVTTSEITHLRRYHNQSANRNIICSSKSTHRIDFK